MKKFIAVALMMGLSNLSYAHSQAQAVIQNSYGKVGQNVRVLAQFNYTIENPTNTYQNYAGEETIVVNGHRYRESLIFSLPPHGTISKSNPAVLTFIADRAGEFKSTATIAIAGNVGAAHTSSAKVKISP